MEQLKQIVKTLLEYGGFNEPSVEADLENKKLIIFVNEGEGFKKLTPFFVSDLEHIVKLLARKHGLDYIFVDVNNYRREREKIIIELAQAAARKALTSKTPVDLPSLNAYERRLIHTELATRPDVKTESIGEGKERHVVIKPSGL